MPKNSPKAKQRRPMTALLADVEAGHDAVGVRVAVANRGRIHLLQHASSSPCPSRPGRIPDWRRRGAPTRANTPQKTNIASRRQLSRNSRRGSPHEHLPPPLVASGRCGPDRAGCGPGPRAGGDTGSWPAEIGRRRPGPGRRRRRDTGRPSATASPGGDGASRKTRRRAQSSPTLATAAAAASNKAETFMRRREIAKTAFRETSANGLCRRRNGESPGPRLVLAVGDEGPLIQAAEEHVQIGVRRAIGTSAARARPRGGRSPAGGPARRPSAAARRRPGPAPTTGWPGNSPGSAPASRTASAAPIRVTPGSRPVSSTTTIVPQARSPSR